jgi:3-oxoadipate enol-lactonase
MPEVTANGVNLYYETFGSGEPLVFVHGFSVDHLVFSALPEHFQDLYQVFLIDNRGSGQSDCPDVPYTIEMMADDILQFCQILNLGPAHFVGHSMGGMILQQLAYRYPQAVKNLVML